MVKYLIIGAFHCGLLLLVSFLLFGAHTFNVLSLLLVMIAIIAWITSKHYETYNVGLKVIAATAVSVVHIVGLLLYFLIIMNFPKHPVFTPTMTFVSSNADAEQRYNAMVTFTAAEDGLSALEKDVTHALNERQYGSEVVRSAYETTANARTEMERLLQGTSSMRIEDVRWDGKIPHYVKVRNWLMLELSEVYRMVSKGRISDAKIRYNELWKIVLTMYDGNQPLIGVMITRSLTQQLVEFPFSWKNGIQCVDVKVMLENLRTVEVKLDAMFMRGVEIEYITFERSLEALRGDALSSEISKNQFLNHLLSGYIAQWPFLDKDELLSKVHAQFLAFRDDYASPYHAIVELHSKTPKTEWVRPPWYKNMVGNVFFAIAMPSYDKINLGKEKLKSQLISARAYFEGGLSLVEKTIDPLTGKPFIVKKEAGITMITTAFEEDGKPVWRYSVY